MNNLQSFCMRCDSEFTGPDEGCPVCDKDNPSVTSARNTIVRKLPPLPGDVVECLDASNGSHFLVAGDSYTVDTVQFDDDGQMRLCLVGMARAWEANRFRCAAK